MTTEEIKAHLIGYLPDTDIRKYVIGLVENASSVEHGDWSIAIGYDPKKSFLCSVCNLMNYEPTDYCPHCGARMKK